MLQSHPTPPRAPHPAGDGCNCVLSGTLRGAGRQALGAYLNLFGYWVVGVPLAWLFGFRLGLGALGFWIGLAVTTSLQVRGGGALATGWCGVLAPTCKLSVPVTR